MASHVPPKCKFPFGEVNFFAEKQTNLFINPHSLLAVCINPKQRVQGIADKDLSVQAENLHIFLRSSATHLLDSSQAVKLGTVKLLLEHKLMEVLRCIGLSLECLKSLKKELNPILKNSMSLKHD